MGGARSDRAASRPARRRFRRRRPSGSRRSSAKRRREVEAAVAFALASPEPPPASASRARLCAMERRPMNDAGRTHEAHGHGRGAARRHADRHAQPIRRVFLLGEDIGVPGGFGGGFTVTLGLSDEFGRDRVIDTPISEGAIVGAAVGAAMAGMRPVAEMQYGDFVFCAMDQVVNQAAKMHYMSNGQVQRADGAAAAGRRIAARRPARAVDRGLVHAHAGPEGRLPVDALRRQGPAARRHPRRQSGDLPRAQAALRRQGHAQGKRVDRARRRRAGGRLRGAARHRRACAGEGRT